MSKTWRYKDAISTSFPGFSPTRPYGARERETGRRENLGTRLMLFEFDLMFAEAQKWL